MLLIWKDMEILGNKALVKVLILTKSQNKGEK